MSQRKLLLADDSITIQKVVNLTFADEGIDVITVGDGDSAMEKMTEVKPDLVMLDVNMPGLNGYQICERIRQSEALKKTPVILLVGSFEPFDEAEARRVGANDYLTKPFQSIRQLVSKVTDLLQGAAQNGESAEAEDLQNAATLREFSPDSERYVSPDESAQQVSEQFGDAGMDDEMIQTDTASSFALDESSKFETKQVDEFQTEGAAQTQPLSPEDVRELSYGGYQAETAEEPVYETSSAENLNEPSIFQSQEAAEEAATPQPAPALEMNDEDDLLEIPFDEEEEWEEEETPAAAVSEALPEQPQQTETQAETAQTVETAPVQSESEETAAVTETPEVSEQSTASQAAEQTEEETTQTEKGAAISAAQTQLSPELIDAIAQKVVEKLSDKAVKDVAWEVVPQMADLIIKKMAEEKLKE